MIRPNSCLGGTLLVADLWLLWSSQASAQAYPNRPVRLIVPAAAGGISDVLARMVADYLDKPLGQRVVVENRPGAAGNLGAELTAKAPPDGYTLCVIQIGNVAMLPFMMKEMPFDPLTDLTPVAPVGETPELFGVKADNSARTLKDFIEAAKREPGKLTYGTPGAGSLPHLGGVLLEKLAGIELVHVPYRGAAPSIVDLAAGQIQVAIAGLGSFKGQLNSGTVRILVIAQAQRLKSLPSVPSAPDAGYSDLEATVWFGIVASKGTPASVVAILNRHVNAMLDDEAVLKRLDDIGVEPMKQTPEQFTALIKRENAKWGAIIRAAGVKME